MPRFLTPLLIVIVGLVSAYLWADLFRFARQPSPTGLDTLGTLPAFELIERSQAPLRLDDLRGKVWVADFMYTSCVEICPLQSAEMARLQAAFADYRDLRLVSISVDPARDTPAVLSDYAEKFQADPGRWLFATGEPEAVARLAQEGFRLSAASFVQGDDADYTFIHSNRFVLVDRQGRIRGYYRSTDADHLLRLRRDLTMLLRQVAMLKGSPDHDD